MRDDVNQSNRPIHMKELLIFKILFSVSDIFEQLILKLNYLQLYCSGLFVVSEANFPVQRVISLIYR